MVETVYVVWDDSRNTPSTMEIQSIGRKWAYLNDYLRFSVDTYEIDREYRHGASGKVYSDKEEYDNYMALQERWKKAINKLPSYCVPRSISEKEVTLLEKLVEKMLRLYKGGL